MTWNKCQNEAIEATKPSKINKNHNCDKFCESLSWVS